MLPNIQRQYLKIFYIFFIIIDSKTSSDYYSNFQTPFEKPKRNYFWNDALNIMSYHRSKMNEYLCKNYIASEIVDSFRNRSGENMEKRVGTHLKNFRLARESLLADSGSKKYKDWLSRSSTLEDIYRQFEHPEANHNNHHNVELEHEGEVTGYALLENNHLYPKPNEYTGDSHPHEHYEEDEYEEKGLKLKELFHFALTAIAFLAFACFMIEVIMCLMEVPQTTEPDYVLLPTTTGVTGPASKVEKKQGRNLNMNPVSLETLNAMSSKILSSIETLSVSYKDDGECLQRILCQNSKYSKSLSGVYKIWLPILGFGMSWIAGRLLKEKTKGKNERGTNTLKWLEATVWGLGNEKCHVLYPKFHKRIRRKKKKGNMFNLST